jgi:hypothetical protein
MMGVASGNQCICWDCATLPDDPSESKARSIGSTASTGAGSDTYQLISFIFAMYGAFCTYHFTAIRFLDLRAREAVLGKISDTALRKLAAPMTDGEFDNTIRHLVPVSVTYGEHFLQKVPTVIAHP